MTTPRARSATSAPGRTSSSAPTRCSCSGPTVRRRASEYNEDKAARRAFALYRDADRAVCGRAGDRSMDLPSLHLPQRLRARLGSHAAGRRVPPAVGRGGAGARTARLGAAGAAHLAPGPGAGYGLALGCGLTRVASGAHFMSDAVFAALVGYVVTLIFWRC